MIEDLVRIDRSRSRVCVRGAWYQLRGRPGGCSPVIDVCRSGYAVPEFQLMRQDGIWQNTGLLGYSDKDPYLVAARVLL